MNDLEVSLPCKSINLDLIIATHNRAGILRHCLDSVLNASIPSGLNVNVFVVDNNSTDDTKVLAEIYSERHPHINYIFVGRAGKSAALNDALAQTNGELVGFIDDDEQIDPLWFQVVHREFCASPELDFIGGPYLPHWETHPPNWVPDLYNGALGITVRGERTVKREQYAVGRARMLMGGNAVIRRSALEQALPYPEDLGKIGNKIRSGEDEVIYHRLLSLGAKGICVPDLVIHHWIPVARLTKRYYRKWVVGRGIAQGSQLRERNFSEASLFGVPRYRFRIAAMAVAGLLTSISSRKRFTAQLHILDCFAVVYGFHFDR